MDIKRLIFATCFVFFTITCGAKEHAFKHAKESALFENTALTMCLGMGYAGREDYFSDQFSQATRGYIEFSSISIDAYDDLRAAIKLWLKKGYYGKNGVDNISMKCVDFSRSAEVRAIFEKYNPCKSRDTWLEENEYRLRCG